MTKNLFSVFVNAVFVSIVLSFFAPITIAQNNLNITGYFSTRYEKQFETKMSSKVIEGLIYNLHFTAI